MFERSQRLCCEYTLVGTGGGGGGRGEAGRPVKELLQDTESVPVQLGVTGVAVGRHRQRLEGRPQHFWRLDGGCGKGKARTTLALLV